MNGPFKKAESRLPDPGFQAPHLLPETAFFSFPIQRTAEIPADSVQTNKHFARGIIREQAW
jgi:hypothetical protein